MLLAFCSILFLSVLMMVLAWNTIHTINSYQGVAVAIDGMQIDILKLDLAIKDFLADGYKQTAFHQDNKSKSIDSFVTISHRVMQRMHTIEKVKSIHSGEALETLMANLPKLDSQFFQITSLYKIRGFKDFGLEGELRKAIHAVENSPFPYNKADMLMLRRHEKDFFLRRDLKYLTEFNKKEGEFIEWLRAQRASDERAKIAGELNDYHDLFNRVVEIDKAIGLQEDQGKKKRLSETLTSIHQSMETLRTFIQEEGKQERDRGFHILLFLFFVQLIGGFALASFASTRITRSAIDLRDSMKRFAEGVFPEKLIPNGTDETEETKAAFNQLLERIRAGQEFSLQLGEGKLDAAYPEHFRHDILAQSLIKMQQALADATEKQQVINWTNFGAAQLNEVLKDNHDQIEVLGDSILKMIVRYMNINQGALYLINRSEETVFADRIASYAYGKKRFIGERIEAGQGVVGQCIYEKEMIVLTEIPSDYIRITSGLGEAVPHFIMVLPLVFREDLVGILELAAFKRIPEYQLDFLQKIGENIASILFNKKLNSETERLLAEAREQTQQLATQEEEIRQNAEEMHAIQEQLSREIKSLEDENQKLKEQLGSLSLRQE